MNRQRLFGQDSDFLGWLRQQCGILDSKAGFAATDVDFISHAFKTFDKDVPGVRTRSRQAMQMIEVKTRGGTLTSSQLDTYWKYHFITFTGEPKRMCGCEMHHFGVSILKLSNTTPLNSESIEWGRFASVNSRNDIRWTQIDIDQLAKLIAAVMHPDTFEVFTND